MPITMKDCADILDQTELRYHHDRAEQVIRLVFVTSRYRNRRGEHLAVVTVATPDGGGRLRASIERAVDVGDDPATACLAACQFAAAMPLVGVEYDAAFDNLRLVVEAEVADGLLTPLQLRMIIDRLVDATEIWQASTDWQRGTQPDVSETAEAAEKAA